MTIGAGRLQALASFLACPRCQGTTWVSQGDDTEGTLLCQRCRAVYPCRDGVLDLGDLDEEAAITQEREGVRRTEHNPALGGINDEFDDLSRAEGALKDAILALPYGNASRYYAEPGYSQTSEPPSLLSIFSSHISTFEPANVHLTWGLI